MYDSLVTMGSSGASAPVPPIHFPVSRKLVSLVKRTINRLACNALRSCPVPGELAIRVGPNATGAMALLLAFIWASSLPRFLSSSSMALTQSGASVSPAGAVCGCRKLRVAWLSVATHDIGTARPPQMRPQATLARS